MEDMGLIDIIFVGDNKDVKVDVAGLRETVQPTDIAVHLLDFPIGMGDDVLVEKE